MPSSEAMRRATMFLFEHGAHAEVLADRAQQVDGAHLLRPVQVVDHLRGGRSLEVEELRDLSTQALRQPRTTSVDCNWRSPL